MRTTMKMLTVLRAAAGGGVAAPVIIPGPVTITPALGAELITNGTFDANINGWTNNDTPTTLEWSSGRLHVVGSGGTDGAMPITITYTNAAGKWFSTKGDIEVISGTPRFHYSAFGAGFTSVAGSGTRLFTHREAGTGNRILQLWGTTAYEAYLDNVSAAEIILASMFHTISNAFVPRVIKAKVTRTAMTQAGIAHYADANNFVIAYLDGASNVVLLKRVAGTETQVSSAAVTYSAGALLELHYDPSAKTYSVYYNDSVTPKINAASVTDAVFVTAQGSHLFSTYDSNSFADIEASPNPT
jgi:hypothetical protein